MNPLDEAITLVDYDESWPPQYSRLAARVRAALGEEVLSVEHVGSTAVPGLCAKPIIDLDVVVRAAAIPGAIRALAVLGYVHEGDLGISGREAFRWPAGEPRHHLYLLEGNAAELRRHIAFRDALRSDHRLRSAYASLKRELAKQHAEDRAAYTEGKSAFIAAVLDLQKPDR
jgi:GrpB-like predicted nucleotidyltransferase (UPF0157 family)